MRITVVKSPVGEQMSEIDEQPIVLGREGTLKLADRRVSKRHARLRRDGSHWYVEDMGSTNGTFINGMRVIEPLPINEGDRLKLGSTVLVVSKLIDSDGERHVAEQPAVQPFEQSPIEDLASAESPWEPPIVADAVAVEAAPSTQPQPWQDVEPTSEDDRGGFPADVTLSEYVDLKPADVVHASASDSMEAEQPVSVPPPELNVTEIDADTRPDSGESAQPALADTVLPAHGEGEPPAPTNDALNPWLSDLPAKRTPGSRSVRPASDDAILFSIRPFAQREDAATPAWRRTLPYSILALVLFVVAANLVLLALFRREARRDAAELRGAIARQDQVAANLIVQELREELRAPSPQQLQAMQDLGDGLLSKQTNLTEKLQAELAAHREYITKQAARQEEPAAGNEPSQAALLRELSEIKQSIAALNQQAAPQTVATLASGSVSAPVEPAKRQDAESAAQPPASPQHGAPPAAAPSAATVATAVTAETTSPRTTFVIDASGALQHSIRDAVAEVRRMVDASRQRASCRVLLLYQGRLFELSASTFDPSADPADPIDRGPADLAMTVKVALIDRPRVLHLLSDTLGNVEETAKVIRAADTSGTSIHVTQFFSRDSRDQLKALARDYNGTYSHIAPR